MYVDVKTLRSLPDLLEFAVANIIEVYGKLEAIPNLRGDLEKVSAYEGCASKLRGTIPAFRDIFRLYKLRYPDEAQRLRLAGLKVEDILDDLYEKSSADLIEKAIPGLLESLAQISQLSLLIGLDYPGPLPEQAPGIRFAFDLDARAIGIDRQPGKSDVDRVRALQPALHRLLNKAISTLNQGNAYYGFLADILSEYQAEIRQDAADIEFAMVMSLAAEMRNGLAEARTKDASPELPDLPPRAAAQVQSVLDMTDTLLAESELGSTLVGQTELYNETPEQIQAARQTHDSLRAEVEASEGVFTDDAKRLIVTTLDAVDGKGEIKARLLERIVSKNVGIALGGTAVIVATSFIPVLGSLIGIHLSDPVKEASVKSWEDLSPDVKEALSRIRDFVVAKKSVLRRTAKLNGDGDWFARVMTRVRPEKQTFAEEIFDFAEKIRGGRILVVDDDPDQIDIMVRGVEASLRDLGLERPRVQTCDFLWVSHNYRAGDFLIFSFPAYKRSLIYRHGSLEKNWQSQLPDSIEAREFRYGLILAPMDALMPGQLEMMGAMSTNQPLDKSGTWKFGMDAKISEDPDFWRSVFLKGPNF